MTEETKKRVQPTKVQAVLTPVLRDKLDDYKETHQYKNDGEALRAILSAFFNDEADINGGSTEHLEQRLASLENALYHDDMDIPKCAEQAFNEYKGLQDTYNDVADTQREQNAKIRDLEKQIQELKASLENAIAPQPNRSKDIQEISKEKEPIEAVESTTNDEVKPTEETKDNTTPQETEEKIKSLIQSDQQHWEKVATFTGYEQAIEIAKFLIRNGFKNKDYKIARQTLSLWKHPEKSPQQRDGKHYLAYLVWLHGIYPFLSKN